MNKLISVVMSTYNEELRWIEECVESILKQTYRNFEFIIVVDNPLNVELRNLLKRFAKIDSRIKLIFNDENLGLVKSLNIGLSHCNGTYIARMDADDISCTERLYLQKDYLENNNLDFVYSGITFINEDSKELFETKKESLKSEQVKRLLEITNISYHPSWFLKKELYIELGGYREVLYCEDYDFSLRCINRGYKIGKMDRSLLRYRIRKNSISRSYSLEQFLNAKGISNLYKKNKLEDLDMINHLLSISKKQATKKEVEKYIKADKKNNEATALYKNGQKVNAIIKILSSSLISKYYFRKYLDSFRYKIQSMRST